MAWTHMKGKPAWNKGTTGLMPIPWNKGIKMGPNPEHSARMTGRKLSPEHSKKISDGLKGRVFSAEHRRKLSEATKRQVHVYGRKQSKEFCELMSKIHKGKVISAEAKQKMREAKLGKKLSAEHKAKIGAAGIGRTFSDESKKKMSESRIALMASGKIKSKDTAIERKVEAELQKRNINYQKQVPICRVAIVDFYLPETKTVIQADGDYWHNLPRVRDRDARQSMVLVANGYRVYRFWEHEINESVENCINKI